MFAEQLARWKETVTATDAWFGAGAIAVGAVLSVVLLVRGSSAVTSRRVGIAFALLIAGFSVKQALAQAWLADDAFISFRYARNFAEGHGLVWNVGEYVEGYTNFLWTFVLGLGERLGVTAPHLSTALTVLSLVAFVVASTALLSRPGWVPLAPAALALSMPFIEFGTSGLEALPTSASVGIAALWLRAGDTKRERAAWWVLLAALLRPDHALFFAPLGLVQLRAGKRALVHTFAAGLGFAAWWCARWAYYSAFFPNTFHTKADGAYWSQGLVYATDVLLTTQLWLALPLGLLLALTLVRRREGQAAFVFFSLFGATAFALYVMRVGGDFMQYRFGLTSFVLAALFLDDTAGRFASERRWAFPFAVLTLLPLGVSPSLIARGEKKWHLSRESSFYPVTRWFPLHIHSRAWDFGQSLAALPEQGAKAPHLAVGAIGIVGYLCHVPILDMLGLTNSLVAHKKVEKRGRPGHEKAATTAEAISGAARWSLDPGWGPLADTTRFNVNGLDVYLLQDTAALRAIAPVPSPEHVFSFVKTPEDLRDWWDAAKTMYAERPEVLRALRSKWGFVPPEDATRVGTKWLVKSPCEGDVELAACSSTGVKCLDGFLSAEVDCDEWRSRSTTSSPEVLAASFRAERRPALAHVTFDSQDAVDSGAAVKEGVAMTVAPGTLPRQIEVVGLRGAGLLNTYARGDEAQGKLVLRVPVVPGRRVLVSALVGGGSDCALLNVTVAGVSWCGRNDEVLRTHALVVTPVSDTLEVSISDTSSAGWGHLLVDDLQVWPLD